MDKKQAVTTAKDYVTDLYTGEQIEDIGLEEVQYDRKLRLWHITVGFNRRTAANNVVTQFGGMPRRSYKIVTVEEKTESAISLKDRELSD